MPNDFEVEIWRIVVQLPSPSKEVQARRLLERTPLNQQEQIESDRRADAMRQARATRPSSPGDGCAVSSHWLTDPGFAEGEVTIEVRVVGELVELDEPDPPIDTLNRRAWNRIQELHGQAIALRLDQGMPVVTLADGLPLPGQRAERYGRRPGEAKSPRRLGAGAAFMRAMENDPVAQAALKQAQAQIRAVAEALKDPTIQGELERSRREQERAFRALADAIRESLRAARQNLQDLGFTPPKTIEDWEHLARVVELPFETIRAGNFTARDVYDMALAWADRQGMSARLGQAGTAVPCGQPADSDRTQSETRHSARAKWLAEAMLLVRDHPDWSDRKIAKRVGKAASTLSRSKEYKAAAAMARGRKDQHPRGFIVEDADTGQTDVEAYADEDDPRS